MPEHAPLDRFHAEVDARCRTLEARHASRLRCAAGCAACCVDGIAVFRVEAEQILRGYREEMRRWKPRPAGTCAFLDDQDRCRVYDARPYVCRTQGLPLRWLEESGPHGFVEYRDICPLNDDPDEPIEQVAPEDCWTVGPIEQRLAEIQTDFGDDLERVPLRDLFEKAGEV